MVFIVASRAAQEADLQSTVSAWTRKLEEEHKEWLSKHAEWEGEKRKLRKAIAEAQEEKNTASYLLQTRCYLL